MTYYATRMALLRPCNSFREIAGSNYGFDLLAESAKEKRTWYTACPELQRLQRKPFALLSGYGPRARRKDHLLLCGVYLNPRHPLSHM